MPEIRLGASGLVASANVSILFPGHSLHQRLRLASRAGFGHVEMWWPFSSATPSGREVDELLEKLAELELQLTALNFFAGDMAAGERGVVSDPAQEVMFRDHVATALHIADRVGCLMLNALYGNTTVAEAADSQREVAWRNYEYARALAHRQGANILLETLNPHDNPRYPMTHLAQAAELVESLGGPAQGIGLLFDVYHVQRTEGDLIARFRAHVDNISHVQIADAPTRSAPGAGEVAFGPVLAAIADAGYDGYVGLEYHQSNAAEGFAWIANLSDGATPRAEGMG